MSMLWQVKNFVNRKERRCIHTHLIEDGVSCADLMKVFISGPHSDNALDGVVMDRVYNITDQNIEILVGDAPGVDTTMQFFLWLTKYENVKVYTDNIVAQESIGNWAVIPVAVPQNATEFDSYSAKDIKMIELADYGFVIWDGKSQGILSNIIGLTRQKKPVLVYFTPQGKFYTIKTTDKAREFVEKLGKDVSFLFDKLVEQHIKFERIAEWDYINGEQMAFATMQKKYSN